MTKTIAISITSFLFVPVALAGSPAGKAHKRDKAQKVQRLLQKFDTNRDGVLDATELEAVIEFRHKRKANRKRRALKHFDTNRDGQLDQVERQAMRAARAQRRTRLMQKLDKNGDGKLDAAEKKAARKLRATMRFDRMLKRFDSDHDGAISWVEIQSKAGQRGGHPGKGKRKARLHTLFQRADANNDNVLTRGEFNQAMKRLRGNKRGTR